VGHTKTFEIKTCVRQGCVLSPLLFITYMDYISKLAYTKETEEINKVLFTDDQLLFYESIENLQNHLDRHTI
jgi:hypothetical protein